MEDLIVVEENVLGAIMLENAALEEVIDILIPELFFVKRLRTIAKAILELRNENVSIDIITVFTKLKSKNEIELVGGVEYVSNLTSKVASTANIEDHVKALHQRWIKKEVIIMGESLMIRAKESDSIELLNQAELKLSQIGDLIFKGKVGRISDSWEEMVESMEKRKQNKGGLSGIDTGFNILNEITNGWQEPDLITLAARPGMGKTSLALNFAVKPALKHNIPTAIFSLEMSSKQLTQRIVSQETSIPLETIIRKDLTQVEQSEFNQAEDRLKNLPIFIDDTSGISVKELRSKLSKLKRESNIRLVVIDYLQLMQSGKGIKDATQEVTAISNGLKRIAKDLNLPIIVLSQLSRDVEKRGGEKRPQLSDLRQSGAIEQDSDMVIFLYRAEYYGITENEDGTPTDNEADVIIAKYRNGTTGIAKLKFIGHRTTFEDFNEIQNSLEPDLDSWVN